VKDKENYMTTILVIDDERTLRENICETLALNEYEAIGAQDGNEGIDLAKTHLPDLVLCDVMMPDVDGFAVLDALRGYPETQKTPFIFLTALAERHNVRQGMELGADDYLTKPFTTDELMAAVQTRLDRHKTVTQVDSKELQRAKNELINLVAHELRTPIASIDMVKNMLSQQLETLSHEEARQLIDILHTGSERMKHLIEQMVTLTELRVGTLTEKSIAQRGEATPLWSLLQGAVGYARSIATRNNDLPIILQHNTEQTAYVLSYSPTLKHALTELIVNSMHFSPKNGQIAITQTLSNKWVSIAIEDAGNGMTPEQLRQALIEFNQINRETNEQQGMGLGLPLAKRIIELHGGELHVNSDPKIGTLATVELPLVYYE
jgi:signal transduction histidine kinase